MALGEGTPLPPLLERSNLRPVTHLPLPRLLIALCFAVSARSQAQALAPLRPGDIVTVRLPGENTLPERLEVDGRGIVTLPRVGPLPVTDLAPLALTDSIRARYGRLFSGTDITVLLLRRITVFGEVNKPGVLFLEPTAAIRDAIASAEGATPLADVRHILLIRGDRRERIDNWADLSAVTRPLQSGDAIMFDRESWIRRNVPSLLGSLGVVASIAIALLKR
jgi:protein involved in polysaccharide export with SLBB domain